MGALDGMVAVVAGGSRGIGRGCVHELAAQGALVYVAARTRQEDESQTGRLSGVVADAADPGGQVVPVVCDLRDDDRVASLFAQVAAQHGQLDLLVNTAYLHPEGTTFDQPYWQTPISYWDDQIDVGPRAAYTCSWHAAQLMVPAGRGLIVNLSSMGAQHSLVHPTYGIAKSATDRLTRETAVQLRPHNVTVVSLWPYLVRTEWVLDQDTTRCNFGTDLEQAESPRFAGRAVAALASAADLRERSGGVFTTRQLAEVYGFADVDGSLPLGSAEPAPSTAVNSVSTA